MSSIRESYAVATAARSMVTSARRRGATDYLIASAWALENLPESALNASEVMHLIRCGGMVAGRARHAD